MAVTNVFFEFPCFIERWLVNNNNNSINCEYFVNKHDIIGHVRLDNNNITSFRAPVSGYLTILIRENIRVRKGLNVAAIYPMKRNTNTITNTHSSNHQIQNIQTQLNHHQMNARYQSQPQTIQSHPSNINMNLIPPHNINMNHPSNIPPPPYHQIRHAPHHIPINNISNRPPPPPPPPPPQYIHNRPPHPNYIHHPPPIYAYPPPQPPTNHIQTQPIITEAKTNANINIKTNVSITETKTNKSPQDPRKSNSLSNNNSITPIKNNNKSKELTLNTTPNSMFTKHWNYKINGNIQINASNISKIKTNLHKNKKLLLVLDIDHTLVHATRDIRAKDLLSHEIIGEDVYEIEFIDPTCNDTANMKQIYWVKLRPFLRKFLKVLSQFFCLAIYTMGIRPYADEILKIIDPTSTIFEHRMICRGDIGINQINGMKDISHLPQCDPKMILIADDRDDVWTTPMNVVKVHKFKYWPNENNLATNVNTNNTNNNNNNSDVAQQTREQLFPWNKDCILEKDGAEAWNLEILKQKLNDNILYNTANILQAVHYVYYNDMNTIEQSDCRVIYSSMKQLVFKGVKCAFSGVIPTNEDPRNHPLWKLIESYGGEPTDCLSNNCTHLIAAKPGTFKVTKSNEMNIWVVHYNWVYQSVIEFGKCKEIKYMNLIKPNGIGSFIPKDVYVKPKVFGKKVMDIKKGIEKYPKIVTKHQFQRQQMAEKEKEIKLKTEIKCNNNSNCNENNKMTMDLDVKDENNNINVKQESKIENNNETNNDIEMDNNKAPATDNEQEEGEIKESSPTPPPPPEKISVNSNSNNGKNDIVIQLPPPNSPPTNSKQITSELPEYIQLPKRNKNDINSNNKNKTNIPLPSHIALPTNKNSNNKLPSHIALPEKNKSKILAQHQSNVAKLRILNSDIKQHHNTSTQIIKDTTTQVQVQVQPQTTIIPKPQIIRLQAPKLNPLRCSVPTIPAHLRQPQFPIKPIHIQSNTNDYIPVSMQSMQSIQPPPPPTHMHVIMPPPPAITMNGIPQPPPHPIPPMMHVIKPTTVLPPPPPPPMTVQKKDEIIHPGDKDHRKDKHLHKDYADIDHRKSIHSLRDNRRDRERDRYNHRSHRNERHSKRSNSNSNSLSRSRTRSRSRSRSRSPHYYGRKSYRKRNRRSRSRSNSPFYNSRSQSHSHSSSLSSLRHRRDRDRDIRRGNDRYRKENTSRSYQIIGKKGVGFGNKKNNKRYDDNIEWNDNQSDDGFDQLLQSYTGGNNKYKNYNRYSDDEQKIDYGVNDSNNNDNKNTGNENSIDYGAI